MNEVRTKNRKCAKIISLSFMSFMFSIGLLLSPSAQAQDLDSAALQNLAFQGAWVADHPEFGNWNWNWNKDGTVCSTCPEPILNVRTPVAG
jgi:hypothetical protein